MEAQGFALYPPEAPMHVTLAQPADIPAWLDLAQEVEPLFGAMVADSGFHAALERNIARQTALCIREQDGPPGMPLMGASDASLQVQGDNVAARALYARL